MTTTAKHVDSGTDMTGQTLATLGLPAGPTAPRSEPGLNLPAVETQHRIDGKATAIMANGPLATLQAGQQLDKYQILDVLGRGGMGVVFKARDTVLERTVAIKVLAGPLAEKPAARQRFMREGRTAAAVKDQHVVTVYGVEEHESLPYIVLEYVEGRSLEDVLAKTAPLPVDEVVKLGAQIAQGLAAAHQKGLIHRDVKPANILVESDTGRVALTDFGLARAVDDASLSHPGEVCGTPHYMAPEQVRGEAIDHRADLFSLGSVLYYMCTGELPFAAPNSMAVLHRVCTDHPKPIRERNPAVPAWLAEIIAGLHAKAPDQRLQSAADVKAALIARLSGAMTPVVNAAEAPAHERGKHSLPGRVAFAVILGLVFLLSLPAFYFLTIRTSDPPRDERPREQPAVEARRPTAVAPVAPPVYEKPEPAPEPGGKAVAAPAPVERPEPPLEEPVTRKPKAPPREVRGAVAVQTHDKASADFFSEEGLSVRNRTTAEVVRLTRGRNYIPLGEYEVGPHDPPGIKVYPHRFIVSADRSASIHIKRMEPAGRPLMPFNGRFQPPPGSPLPPPPFGPPPPPPPDHGP